jgi:hypothetical protein
MPAGFVWGPDLPERAGQRRHEHPDSNGIARTQSENGRRQADVDVILLPSRPARFFSAHVGTIVFAGLLSVVVGLRFSQLAVAEAPPGADGGDWLTFAHQLAGQQVRAAEAAYPPVVPGLLWALMTVVSPLLALKIVAVFASVAVAVPFYVIVRQEVPALPAALIAVTLPLTGYHSETMAWGGYPQLLGVAFLVATLLTLGEGLATGRRRWLLASGACAALTLGSHQLAAAALVVAVPVFIACLAVQVRPAIRALQRWRGHLFLWLAAAAILSLPIVPFYIRMITLAQGIPANPQGYSLTSLAAAADYAFHEEPLLWTVLSVGGAVFCLATVALRKESRLAASAAALLVASSLIFVSLSEVRAFHIFEVGVLEAVSLLFVALCRAANVSSFGAAARWGGRAAATVAFIGIVVTLAIRGSDRSQDTMAYYRVVDGPALDALRWLEQNTPPGSLVVAGETQRGSPYSWWVEGLSKRPAYSTNLKFLRGYNKEEQDNILYATKLLSPSTSASEAYRLIQARHIAYFFVDKAARQEFAHLTESVPMKVVFENQEIVVLAPITS